MSILWHILYHKKFYGPPPWRAYLNSASPNALYAEINVDYEKNEITLIRGHNYPEPEIINGFDWEYENTHPYEYDENCFNWEFYRIPNGEMLNCYPERKLISNIELLKEIKNIFCLLLP